MAEISLAKALKVKNRLKGRLVKVQKDITQFNSVPTGQTGQVDVPALMKVRNSLVDGLVAVKSAINEGNREIQRDIYALAEKKATVQFLAGLDTKHGPQPPQYPNTIEVTYMAAVKKAEVEELTTKLEIEIDQLQDRLDQFNHNRLIAIDDQVLALAY